MFNHGGHGENPEMFPFPLAGEERARPVAESQVGHTCPTSGRRRRVYPRPNACVGQVCPTYDGIFTRGASSGPPPPPPPPHQPPLSAVIDCFLDVRKTDQGNDTDTYCHRISACFLWCVCIQVQTVFVVTETVNKALRTGAVNMPPVHSWNA